MSEPLHVALDARLHLGAAGGVAEVTRGLVARLHDLPADEFRFSLIVNPEARDDLRAIMPDHCSLLPVGTGRLPVRTRAFNPGRHGFRQTAGGS